MRTQKKRISRKTAKPKKPSKTQMRNRCDSLFSKIIRLRDGRCVTCGTTEGLQCSHNVSRRYLIVRYDLDNAVTHCVRCHLFYTHNPLEHRKWIESYIGAERLAELEAEALRGTEIRYRPAYDLIYAQLLDVMRELESAA